MAKITGMPHMDIISGFKGKLDFYIHDGQACVRRWPKSPGKKRTQAVMDQWEDFRTASRLWSHLSPEIQQAYNSMAQGGSLNGRDLATRAYIKGLFTYPHAPPPPPPIPYLNDLEDVEVPTPSDGQMLTWEAATSRWKAK